MDSKLEEQFDLVWSMSIPDDKFRDNTKVWIDANFISRHELKQKALSLKNPFTDAYQNTAFNIGAESVIALLRR